jgi:hypothetical protein
MTVYPCSLNYCISNKKGVEGIFAATDFNFCLKLVKTKLCGYILADFLFTKAPKMMIRN